jgi:dethiobiotin synthetase
MQGVFITGTDTGVGKTYIGTLLAKQFSQQNISVIPRKPVESGCLKQGKNLVPNDAQTLMDASSYEGSLSEVCPYRFEQPVSPARAAQLSNKVLTTQQLVKVCLEGNEKGFVLVEGAGGFYSPLTVDGLNADLAMALQLPILLVANDAIGCLNQVLLNAEAIKARDLNLTAVVLNSVSEHKDANMNNARDLREFLDCPIYPQPFGKNESKLPQNLIDQLLSQQSKGTFRHVV